MKKEIRQVSEDGKIVQVTVADTERWYLSEDEDGTIVAYPSVTWISSAYPKGTEFYKWLASKGWDESQAIVAAAGIRGHKVHQMITALLQGRVIRMDDTVENPDTGETEAIELDEYEALLSFSDWYQQVKHSLKVIENEQVVINTQVGYAGTIDLICEFTEQVKIGRTVIEPGLWIIDFKTSQQIWPSYEIQTSAYKHALPQYAKANLAILQLGYKRNKNRYKFTTVDDKYELFLAAHKVWQNENPNSKPFVADYPSEISLGITIQKAKTTN